MTPDVRKNLWQADKDVAPKVSTACPGIVDLAGKFKVSELQEIYSARLHGSSGLHADWLVSTALFSFVY